MEVEVGMEVRRSDFDDVARFGGIHVSCSPQRLISASRIRCPRDSTYLTVNSNFSGTNLVKYNVCKSSMPKEADGVES